MRANTTTLATFVSLLALSTACRQPMDVDDGPQVSGPLEIEAVEPPFGSNSGGTLVTIVGNGFDAETRVLFGDVEGTIEQRDVDQLVVRTPALSFDGVVDLVIRSGDREQVAPAAFEYWEDSAGKVGLFGELETVSWVGSYWEQVTTHSARLVFHEPMPFSYSDLFTPQFGRCGPLAAWDGVDAPLDPGVDSMILEGPKNITLTRSEYHPDHWFQALDIDPDRFAVEATYGLAPMEGGVWPAFDLPMLVRPPAAFQVTAPALDGAEPDVVERDFAVRWNGAPASYAILVYERYRWDDTHTGVDAIDSWACAVPDTGSYTFDGWPSWQSGDLIVVSVARIRDESVTLPHNNANTSVVGSHWIIGMVEAG